MAHVLVVAGTTEATELANRLDQLGHQVISSLAGVTSNPATRAGRTRSGGFGGVAGLTRFLVDQRVDAVIDATHPFAATMPFNVDRAATHAGIPHCRLLRTPWFPEVGDRWIEAATLDSAAELVRERGAQRVFLAVGRQSLDPFRACGRISFVVRSVEPLGDALPGAVSVQWRARPDVAAEVDLLTEHQIDLVVSKNSGGSATVAKLVATRRLGLPVVMVSRPRQPDVVTVTTVAGALDWLARST